MTAYQKELLDKMKTGRKVTIYRDDPRTILHSADGHPAGSERVSKWTSVVALLMQNKIKIVKSTEHSTTYEAV